MGTNYSKTNEIEKGIIQISIDYLFNRIKEISKENNCEFIIKVSFIEIYNEEIRDLFNLKTPPKNIILREINNSVSILGVTEMPVLDSNDTLNLIWTGSLNRKTASTYSNDVSSRSHAIFTLNIEKIMSHQTVNFKISFIDLAGSESIKKSKVKGERFKESVSINSGLLSLSKVIMALSEESKKHSNGNSTNVHIPYRESKLTRILKDSLGGSAITIMLACVSPCSLNIEETINTLNYASFAKSVKIQPMVNCQISTQFDEEIVDKLLKENEELKKNLEKFKNSIVQAENFKLKGIIKILREKLNLTNKINNVEIENIFDEFEQNKNEDEELDENDFNNLYINESNLEIEHANKISEVMKLKEENENLIFEIQILKEKEKEYEIKLGVAANMIGRQDEESKINSISFQEYFNSNNAKSDKKEINTRQVFVSKSMSDIKLNNYSKNESRFENKQKSASSLLNLTFSKQQDPQINLISGKIKQLKEFQFSLKQKIMDNELYKNKLVRNKNEEITYFRRDAFDKNKKLKNFAKVFERNNELLEQSETTINILKDELRNKSQELKRIKLIKNQNMIPLPNNNQNSDNKQKIRKRSFDASFNTNSNSSVLITDQTNIKTKNNYTTGNSNKSLNLYNNITLPEEPKEFYFSLKNLMKKIEDLIIQKLKFEKRLKYLDKEKIQFINLIEINEKRTLTKLDSLNKQKKSLERILNVMEETNKEKINYSNKYQSLLNKISCLSNRLERSQITKENTFKEIISNEEILKDQIGEVEKSINVIKNKISGVKNEKENSSLENEDKKEEKNNYKFFNENEVDDLIKEKDEKLVFIELDNMYKDRKIIDLEKNLKETILKYEDKIFQLQFDLKNLSNSNHLKNPNEERTTNNMILTEMNSTIDKSEYNTVLKKTQFVKPKAITKSTVKNILPPSNNIMNKNFRDKSLDKKNVLVSTINELTSPPRKIRSNNYSLNKNKLSNSTTLNRSQKLI